MIALPGPARKGLAPWLAALAPLSGLAAYSAGGRHSGPRRPRCPGRARLCLTGAVRGSPRWHGRSSIGWAIDSLTAVMLAVVGAVALCVVVFSVGYMADDEAGIATSPCCRCSRDRCLCL